MLAWNKQFWLCLVGLLWRQSYCLRIVFGSCNKQSLEQPFWKLIVDRNPDKLLLTGDNIYADIRDARKIYKLFSKHSVFSPAPPDHLAQQYAILGQHEGFQQAVNSLGWDKILTVYDDHDYGINDGDKLYEYRNESKQLFLDFWHEPADSPRRSRDGIYTSVSQREGSHEVKYVILDERYNRDPYGTVNGDFLGETQWKWLEKELADPTPDVIILVSSIQMLGDDKLVGEYWGKFPQARRRMLDLIRRCPVSNVLIVSGDVHYAEVTRVRCGTRGVTEVTSSGMTHAWTDGGFTRAWGYRIFQSIFPAHYREFRYDDQFGGLNIGELDIRWGPSDGGDIGKILIRIFDKNGDVVIKREEPLHPRGFYEGKETAACEPYWGPVRWYQEMFLWLVLAAILVVFVIIPFLALVWFAIASVLYFVFKYENSRRDRLEKVAQSQRKKRD